MSDIAIKVDGISKIYKLYKDPFDRVKEALHPFGKRYHRDFFALNDVSFEVKKGESIGIIGKNGAGKSTLLKILSGVLTPNSGSYFINGKIFSLLELGIGFNPEITGMENIYFHAAILGFSEEKIKERLESILDFADIGQFINQPIKTYSSGMRARLAFAIAVNSDPDILIIDEVLAVGDIRFNQKCLRKMKEFRDSGKTILLVSHGIETVLNYCDKALWIDDGKIKQFSIPLEVCSEYSFFMNGDKNVKKEINTSKNTFKTSNVDLELDSVSNCEIKGNGKAKISKVALYSNKTNKKISIHKGEKEVTFFVEVEILENIEKPAIGFMIKDKLGNGLAGYNNELIKKDLSALKKGEKFIASFVFNFPPLKNDKYFFNVGIVDRSLDQYDTCCRVYDAYIVNVANDDDFGKSGYRFLVDNPKFEILK